MYPTGRLAHHEGGRREQVVQAAVEVGVLQAVLSNKGEDAVQRQDAVQSTRVQRGRQEVGEQVRVGQVGHDIAMHLDQHLLKALITYLSVKPLV